MFIQWKARDHASDICSNNGSYTSIWYGVKKAIILALQPFSISFRRHQCIFIIDQPLSCNSDSLKESFYYFFLCFQRLGHRTELAISADLVILRLYLFRRDKLFFSPQTVSFILSSSSSRLKGFSGNHYRPIRSL